MCVHLLLFKSIVVVYRSKRLKIVWLSIYIYILLTRFIILLWLSRYVLAYRGNSRQQCMQGHGRRESGMTVVHVVTASCSSLLLQTLLNDRLLPLCSAEDTEIQVSTAHWGGKPEVLWTRILSLIPTTLRHKTHCIPRRCLQKLTEVVSFEEGEMTQQHRVDVSWLFMHIKWSLFFPTENSLMLS